MAFNLKSAPMTTGVRVLKCGSCGRTYKPLDVDGEGRNGVLIVLEQPSMKQSEALSWFSGYPTILSTLAKQGYDVEQEFWVTGLFACHGTSKNYEYCLARLERTIKKLQPRLIIADGSVVTGAILRLYNSRHFGLGYESAQYVGRFIPLMRRNDMFGCWFAPVMSDTDIHTYENPNVCEVAKKWLYRHLEYAMEHYVVPPQKYEHPEPELLFDADRIVEALKEAALAKYSAFDYETNCLQPESLKARVLTASVAYGDSDGIHRGFAFPMSAEIVKRQWVEFLKSNTKKIIANVKFEERWSTVLFKQQINNFYWDVCIGGRIFDCYSGVSGLKFLTFEQFGEIGYDDDVAPFIKGEGDKLEYNNLAKMDVSKLLLYNCLDSIYTYAVAEKQHQSLGLEF